MTECHINKLSSRVCEKGTKGCEVRHGELSASPTGYVADSRKKFENWITAPPIELPIARFKDHEAWPGNYVRYEVQLAWEAWEEAKAT